jgi:hypothetical protein
VYKIIYPIKKKTPKPKIRIKDSLYYEDLEHCKIWVNKILKKLVDTYGIQNEFYYLGHFTSRKVKDTYIPHQSYSLEMISSIFDELEKEGKILKNGKKLIDDPLDLSFKITENFNGKTKFQDFIKSNEYFLEEKLANKYPRIYRKLDDVQLKLNKDNPTKSEITQSGLLMVEFWEDFSDSLWTQYIKKNKPDKEKTREKLSLFFAALFIDSEKELEINLFDTFRSLTKLCQNIKHGRKEAILKNARKALIITTMIADDLLEKLENVNLSDFKARI